MKKRFHTGLGLSSLSTYSGLFLRRAAKAASRVTDIRHNLTRTTLRSFLIYILPANFYGCGGVGLSFFGSGAFLNSALASPASRSLPDTKRTFAASIVAGVTSSALCIAFHRFCSIPLPSPCRQSIVIIWLK